MFRRACGKIFPLLLLLGVPAFAQDNGSVAGVVVSTWNGSPLAGVAVTVRGTTLGAQGDASGRFELKNVPPGNQVLRFSKSGYASAMVTDVRVLPGQTTAVNGNLRPEFYDLEEYEVTAEEFVNQTEKIMLEREKSSGMLDAIGSEQFSRLGATDAAAALGKVTGASIVEGKFAVVRGLPDRYTSTTLNGGDIPSADPNRRAVQLDLFPSQFIDQLNVRKTFTPDMAGGFSGGAVDIVTKTFPEKPMFSLSVGTAYNTQSSLRNDFLFTDRGGTDWLAMDDGKRALPGIAAATSPLGTSSPLNPAIKDSFASRQFAPIAGSSPLNTSMSLALGETRQLFGHRLGVLGGLYYKQEYFHYDDGTVSKFDTGSGRVDTKMDVRSLVTYIWGAQVGLSYEFAEDHQVTFNFFTVATAEDEARRLQGQDSTAGTVLGESYLDQSIIHWTERTLNTFQLKGNHVIKELGDLQFSWVGSLASTTQDEPDNRIFQSFAQPGNPDDPNDDFYLANGSTKPSRPTRIWRSLQEDNFFFRGDFAYPLPSYTTKDNFVKAGAFISNSKREYSSRAFDVRTTTSHPFTSNGDPNSYLAQTNLGFIDYYNFPGSYVYTGQQTIDGFYGMGEWSALEWLQIIGGARFERTDLSVVSDNLGQSTAARTSSIKQNDILPSLGMVVTLYTNLYLRASWSQTVVRPTYREISVAEVYDTAQGRTYLGNPGLKMSSSENFDVRLEWYPSPGDLISVSVFKKKIKDPIEQASQNRENDFIFYNNFEKADVMGAEFEFRKSFANMSHFIRDFSLGFNFTYITSEVPLTPVQYAFRVGEGLVTPKTRPMFDQPEYIGNVDITWDHKSSGTAITLSGGIVGRRLVISGLATPDEYEEPAPQLDVFFTQALGKHWTMKFSAKNLLDPVYETTQNYDFMPGFGAGQVVTVRSYTKGITLGLSLGCLF